MYAYIDGTVAEKGNNEIIIEAAGIGYSLMCSVNTLAAAPSLGESMKCYTYLSVKEDSMELFGFASKLEKAMFLSLCSISGIGPRTALSVLGSMPLKDLSLAIVMGDVTALSQAPGIGKKTAQRIALELKDKVAKEDLTIPQGNISEAAYSVDSTGVSAASEAIAALQALGYTSLEASRAIQAVRGQSDQTDELIRLALRGMTGL